MLNLCADDDLNRIPAGFGHPKRCRCRDSISSCRIAAVIRNSSSCILLTVRYLEIELPDAEAEDKIEDNEGRNAERNNQSCLGGRHRKTCFRIRCIDRKIACDVLSGNSLSLLRTGLQKLIHLPENMDAGGDQDLDDCIRCR